jgi:regulatory protein
VSSGRTSGAGRRGSFGRRGPAKAPEQPESVDAVRGKAIGLLARRDYPSRALKTRLEDAGFTPAAVESAVTELEDERFVSDERYVEAAVRGRAGRGQGPIRISIELRRQGVAPALVAEAVDARSPVWAERATELRHRRFGAGAPKDPRERARQVRFLLQRGFTGDHVRLALGAAAADLELDEDLSPLGEDAEDPGE